MCLLLSLTEDSIKHEKKGRKEIKNKKNEKSKTVKVKKGCFSIGGGGGMVGENAPSADIIKFVFLR